MDLLRTARLYQATPPCSLGPPAGRRVRPCPLEASGHVAAATAIPAASHPQVDPVAWGGACLSVMALTDSSDSSTAGVRRGGGRDPIALASLSLMAPTDGSDRPRPPRSHA